VAVLESVLDRNPVHPGATHLYIHTMEATHPRRAEAAADRLAGLMPGAGHMVHMPSHIYMRVGRYADAAAANERAVAADEDYITQCRAQGIYPMAYYPHNIHFLWAASTMEGRGAVSVEAARKTASQVSDEMLEELPLLAGFRVIPYYALTRFGRWDAMLAEPAPPPSQAYLAGSWHYARGLAFLGKGRVAEAEAELAALATALDAVPADQTLFSPNTARAILAIAPEVLGGEIAARRGDFDLAIARLERAVRLEDGLVYTEPEEWHYSPRLALGAVLLAAGRPAEAETVYWEELRQSPESGWALFGVAQALAAQGREVEARLAERRFARAWSRADVTLTASRF
jgi:tetratricopeptide (TPR) repeat protein